jgi:hypothetical protein
MIQEATMTERIERTEAEPQAETETRAETKSRAQADVLDESLSRLAATGPEFAGGLSNHGPMAAEAMIRLGRPADVELWLDRYIRRLEAAPSTSGRVTDENWREALGIYARVADWELYLRDQFAGEPWREVLARWWQRLVPGLAANATHGIIRTSHAARSVAAAQGPGAGREEAPDGGRLAELARGLAYWAAGYLELPGAPRTAGRLDLDAAISGLPVAAGPIPDGLISTRLSTSLAAEPRFPEAVQALRPPTDTPADLRDLAIGFARVFLIYGRTQPIDFLHAVTAPVAARSVLGLLPAELARPSYDALWQVAAGLYSGYAVQAVPEPLPEGEPPTPDVLTDRAVATDDVHAIKLTEACLRLYCETPDPLLLHAAARGSELLGRRR